MPLRSVHAALLLGSVVTLLTTAGCAHRQPLPIPTKPQVASVRVQGAKQIRQLKVRDALGTRATPWWARILGTGTRRYWIQLNRDLVLEDQTRLERFYEDHGHFDAQCVGLYTRYKGKKVGDGRRWAVVTFTVKEGPQSAVRQVDLLGVEHLDPQLLTRLSRRIALTAGQPFSLPQQEQDRTAIERALAENGHAYARVERRADAYPEEQAVDLTYRAEPGIACRFGAVTLDGLDRVPRKRVAREVRIEAGDPYSLTKLQKLQADLFGMGVFSMVTVTPDRSDESQETVPVHVTVREAKPISIKLGFGLGMERGRDDFHTSVGFSHSNVFRLLWQLQANVRGGVAFVPDLLSSDAIGPVVEADLQLTQPLPIRPLTLWERAGFEVDVESGYKFISPSVSVGLNLRIHRKLSAGIAYHYEFFWLYSQEESLSELTTYEMPELDTDSKYNLSYLEQHLTWDARDDPVTTSRGAYARFSVAEAGGFLSGGFDYVKLSWEVRGFIDPVPKTLVLAAHVQAGWILPWGDTSAAPLSQRFKIGGSGTVRAWGRDSLGPRYYPESDDEGIGCGSADASEGDCDAIPLGGHLTLFGGPEIRAYFIRAGKAKLGLAVFFDAGRVWEDEGSFDLADLMLSTGLGPRLVTKFGTFRLDVGFRLNSDDEFADDSMWALHFGFSEAF